MAASEVAVSTPEREGRLAPLMERTDRGTLPLLTAPAPSLLRSVGERVPVVAGRLPDRVPAVGEQYRFHVDMSACIGCKCCVVACNEQNGNPASINWRRVVEIEGGWYPRAQRAYLSMGCNHCVDPACLMGCPVDAYTKSPLTGIVHHSADACIGCQYCTWNCSYGVPQYNPERGVVGKCDMCHGRLDLGQAPACVNACPEGAIGIEIVNIAEWRAICAHEGRATGVPGPDGSLSTTRATLPVFAPNARPVDTTHPTAAEPHWALIIMTVLTQLSVGAFAAIWLLQVAGGPASFGTPSLGAAAMASLCVAGIALAASTFHLGRPAHAYRALKAWKRSWLSREVLLFTAFSGVAALYAALLWFQLAGSSAAGLLTTALGIGGVVASAYIYRVPARPAWNNPFTLGQFLLSAGTLGPLFAAIVRAGDPRALSVASATMATVSLTFLGLRFLALTASDRAELQGTARLLSTTLRNKLVARGVLLVVGGVMLPLLAIGGPTNGGRQIGADVLSLVALGAPALNGGLLDLVRVGAFVMVIAGEILGRYLFFVSVVPTHMSSPYIPLGSEAA
jgi:Fe-S-cluster-containing dehydrogenase component/DMSO reductase anchor subunit